MAETFDLDHVASANGRTWAEDVDPTVNRVSLMNLGRLTNIGGTANAITGRLPLSTGFTAIADNSEFLLVPASNNTGAVTLQLKTSDGVSNLGAAFALRTPAGAAMPASGLVADSIYRFHYNASEGYARMIAPAASLVKGSPNALIYDKKASGTDAGAATSGSWETRDLNTEYDPQNLITLSANTFIPLYSGWVRFRVPSYDVTFSQARLYNVTDAVAVDPPGTNAFAAGTADAQQYSVGSAPVVAGKTYRIEGRVTSTKTVDGKGRAASFGDEIYAFVEYYVDPF